MLLMLMLLMLLQERTQTPNERLLTPNERIDSMFFRAQCVIPVSIESIESRKFPHAAAHGDAMKL